MRRSIHHLVAGAALVGLVGCGVESDPQGQMEEIMSEAISQAPDGGVQVSPDKGPGGFGSQKLCSHFKKCQTNNDCKGAKDGPRCISCPACGKHCWHDGPPFGPPRPNPQRGFKLDGCASMGLGKSCQAALVSCRNNAHMGKCASGKKNDAEFSARAKVCKLQEGNLSYSLVERCEKAKSGGFSAYCFGRLECSFPDPRLLGPPIELK